MAKQTFTTGQVLTAAQMTSLQQTAMGGGSPSTKTTSYVLVAADAGTVIQMNAAGSTTITVNTALFSAGDSVQIQNIGAGVCTITAGTATVNTAGSLALSQWEGGFLYFTSASSAIFFDVVQSSGMTNPMTTAGDTIYGGASGTPTRLAIGSTGNVLTVSGGNPVWAAPSSSATSYSLLNAGGTSLTGSGTITISSLSGYNKLFAVIKDGGSNTAGQTLLIRFNADSGSNYRYGVNKQIGASAYAAGNTTASGYDTTTSIQSVDTSSNASSLIQGFMQVDGCNSSGIKMFNYSFGATAAGGNSQVNYTGGGNYLGTSVISSMSFIIGGTWNSGTVYIYGGN